MQIHPKDIYVGSFASLASQARLSKTYNRKGSNLITKTKLDPHQNIQGFVTPTIDIKPTLTKHYKNSLIYIVTTVLLP